MKQKKQLCFNNFLLPIFFYKRLQNLYIDNEQIDLNKISEKFNIMMIKMVKNDPKPSSPIYIYNMTHINKLNHCFKITKQF